MDENTLHLLRLQSPVPDLGGVQGKTQPRLTLRTSVRSVEERAARAALIVAARVIAEDQARREAEEDEWARRELRRFTAELDRKARLEARSCQRPAPVPAPRPDNQDARRRTGSAGPSRRTVSTTIAEQARLREWNREEDKRADYELGYFKYQLRTTRPARPARPARQPNPGAWLCAQLNPRPTRHALPRQPKHMVCSDWAEPVPSTLAAGVPELFASLALNLAAREYILEAMEYRAEADYDEDQAAELHAYTFGSHALNRPTTATMCIAPFLACASEYPPAYSTEPGIGVPMDGGPVLSEPVIYRAVGSSELPPVRLSNTLFF